MSSRIEYEDVLRNFIARRAEVDLLKAYELGKQFIDEQTGPEDVVGLHLDALCNLPDELSKEEKHDRVMQSFSVLIETMIAYGIAYADAYRLLGVTAHEAEEAKFELERTIVDLDLANTQLKVADKMKSKFFANMSHELRTPLNAIIGFAEDALDGMAGELNPKQARYVGNILTAGRHLLTVINDILDLAKLSAGKVEPELQPVKLAEVIAEVQELLAPLLARKQQQLEVNVPSGLPWVNANRAKLTQIFLNLISNAHKFTAENGTLAIRVRLEGLFVRVDVCDTGIGIASADLTSLFEEFKQVSGPRALGQQGTGLGLAITKQLVVLHGGELTVTSEVGKGSVFSFTLAAVELLP